MQQYINKEELDLRELLVKKLAHELYLDHDIAMTLSIVAFISDNDCGWPMKA
ncbi:MAG: hypothetical protein NT094_05040 [Candidatus Staskawiczbacteria bacterium]|nr:hypothetical protein [Candidatus Staskawiczbacteria bacterium]